MGRPAGGLSIERWSGRGEHALVLRGVIDEAGARRLERAVRELCAQRPRRVELDLGRLDSVDHHGIEAILAAKATCEDHRAEFRLVPPRAETRAQPGRPVGSAAP